MCLSLMARWGTQRGEYCGLHCVTPAHTACECGLIRKRGLCRCDGDKMRLCRSGVSHKPVTSGPTGREELGHTHTERRTQRKDTGTEARRPRGDGGRDWRDALEPSKAKVGWPAAPEAGGQEKDFPHPETSEREREHGPASTLIFRLLSSRPRGEISMALSLPPGGTVKAATGHGCREPVSFSLLCPPKPCTMWPHGSPGCRLNSEGTTP